MVGTSRGRPRRYPALLEKITLESGWVTINRQQKTRTQCTQLAKRYPRFAFRAVPNDTTGYDLQARLIDGGE